MSFGMSYEQFWYEELDMINIYIKKHELEIEQRNINQNHNAWMTGLYVFEALAVINQDPKKTNLTYPEKPHELSSSENKENESELTDAEKNYAKMKLVAAAFNNRRKMQGKS